MFWQKTIMMHFSITVCLFLDAATAVASVAPLPPPSPDLTEWYTVCGKPHLNKPLWVTYVAVLATLGIAT